MRKTYLMLAALMLTAFGATNAKADETISLQEVPFTTWLINGERGYGADASAGDPADCAWVVEEPTGLPYGDGSVINGADLSAYSKLVISYSEGSPRVLLNRDVEEGKWNSDEAQSKLIEYPNSGWSSKYFEDDGSTLTVDLKQILKDKGYVRLHAIKGANWADVTVTRMELVRQENAQQVGWINLINNSNMEGDDVSSFFTKVAKGEPLPSEISDGIGVDGSRGIMVAATAKESDAWDNQFWFRFNEEVPAGTKYRVSFDYRADADANVSTQAHAEPSDYIYYDLFGTLGFTSDWQNYAKEGEVTAQQSTDTKKFLSVAFNLNELADANNYYFDNIKFEVYKYGTTIEYAMDAILVDFGFDTNIPALVEACGKPRLVFPEGTVKVTADGEEVGLLTVEGYPDGRFYIFTEDGLDDDAVVEVTFTNPADAKYHLQYTSGPGGDIKNFTTTATYNSDIALADDAYTYMFVKPVVLSSDPENGSFNLPNSIKQFKVTFDKNADCSKIVATLNGKSLKVTPSTGAAEEIILERSGDDLANGEYTLKVDKIYAELPLDEKDYTTYTITFYVGKVEYDPNDVAKAMLPDYFAAAAQGSIPEGWYVKFQQEDRPALSTYGSGSRMFDFAEGGDFTKGLYYREGYAEYGSTEGYALSLEAGKRYDISFMTAMWKDNGTKTRFQIYSVDGDGQAADAVFTSVVDNTPNVGGNQGAVNGAAQYTYKFYPEATGNYILRWTSSASETGDPSYMENLLAKPAVLYMPNQIGLEETQLLNTAIANAKSVRDANSDERYNGAAFDALVAAITKYEAEAPTYTNPSSFKNAAAALDAAAQALKDHRSLCDKFDTLAKKAMELTVVNAENKFAKTELYAQIKAQANKYATTGTDEEGNVTYIANPVKDDNQLTAAVGEMTLTVDKAALLFTIGPSAPENANNGKGTGIAVLVERLRLGAEALKSLGVDEGEEVIQLADNALTDDDAIAEAIKNRLKVEIYGQLKNGEDLFYATGDVDPATDEPVTQSYDMTVFVKNPNTYKQQGNLNFTAENVPGWITPEGFRSPGLTVGWGQPKGNDEIAEDIMFQTWGSSYRVEQTIEDLPAGVYTIRMAFGERMGDDENNLVGSFIYAKTSSTPVAGEDEDEQFAATTDIVNIGQSFPFATTSTSNGCLTISGITVADGYLTIGANAGASSHTFFNEARVILTGAAKGFDYGKAYEEVLSGIDVTVVRPAEVRAIEIYDLNGRRITKAQKGVNILRKLMNDGTIVVEKVLVK